MTEDNALNPERLRCPEDYTVVLDQMRIMAGREERNIELYEYLMRLTMNQMVAQARIVTNHRVLRRNRDTARTNLEILNETYRALTNEALRPVRLEFTRPVSLRQGVERAFFNEIEDAELYREMMLNTPVGPLRDRLFILYSNSRTNVDRNNLLYTRASL
ncbi:hypothetical protein [Natronospora cellulosivora (SeqCode)]